MAKKVELGDISILGRVTKNKKFQSWNSSTASSNS